MLNKNYYITFALMFSMVAGWSQSDSTKYFHWDIGISTGDILHELFNGDNTAKKYPAITLEYSGQKYAVQAGFRPDYNKANTSYEGFLDSEINNRFSVSGHLAVTRIIFNNKNWQIRAGLQMPGGWSREDITEDTGFDQVTLRRLEWNVGLGPVIDVRYYVHPRISFGMEASLIYSVSRSELQQLFTNFPDFDNTKETVKSDALTVVEPATVYIRFHF
jgi:hypothetical protein